MAIKIWGISDNKVGHLTQIKSVFTLLPYTNKLFILNNSILGKLNCFFFPLGVNKNSRQQLYSELEKTGYPHIILAIGRRNLSAALFLKRLVQKQYKDVKLIFLMPPGTYINKNIDYMFMHKYKRNPNYSYPSNVVAINFPPAKINKVTLNYKHQDLSTIINSKFKKNVIYERPYIGVFIGGKAKGVAWNTAVADKLCAALKEILNYNKGSLFVITSRRTGFHMGQYIKNQLPKNIFFWQYTDNSNYNPYLDILLSSDVIIVTGESTSMMADSISINSSAKVLIFDDKIFKGKRFKPFHNYLYVNNYAVPLNEGKIILKNLPNLKKAPNSAHFIANCIINLVNKLENI